MQRLIPDPGPTDIDTELADYRPFESPLEDRPYVAVNMVTTLDGRASLGGRTVEMGTPLDIELLLRLRTRFDAVMIGAGTMRAERYGRIIASAEARAARKRIGLREDPLAVIISGRLEIPFDAGLFTDGAGEVLVFTNQQPPFPETSTPTRFVTVEGPIRITEVLRHLRQERNIRALLSEGGPHTFGQLAASRSFDDLFLTTTAVMTGEQDEPRILEGALPEHLDLRLVRLLEDDGELFSRYCLRR